MGLKSKNILDWTLFNNLNSTSWDSLSTSLFNILKYLIFLKSTYSEHKRKYNFLHNKVYKVYCRIHRQWVQIAYCLSPLWDGCVASLMRRGCKLTVNVELLLMTSWIEIYSSLIPWLLIAKGYMSMEVFYHGSILSYILSYFNKVGGFLLCFFNLHLKNHPSSSK